MSSSKKVLFMMSASVAAFKACQLLSRLVQDGCEVQVVTTPSTSHFVGSATLEGLSGKKVLNDLWELGRAMDHIHLTRWADYAILCPASANTLAKMAHGLADDLIGAMTLAWPEGKPFWIVPAMNQQMMKNPVTQKNLQSLRERGFSVLPTASGALACGEEGEGRMLEPEEILPLLCVPSRGHVLVTGGATREPIDGIRFLSNVSTGQTAATLCDQLAQHGWDMTYLHGVGSVLPQASIRRLSFSSFSDLDARLHEELNGQKYSAVIHCAAVSDYSMESANTETKMETGGGLVLKLKPNFKILPRLKEYSSNRDIFVVGFKLTLNLEQKVAISRAQQILGESVDAVVTNDWRVVSSDRQRHPGTLLLKNGEKLDFLNLSGLSTLLASKFTKGTEHGTRA